MLTCLFENKNLFQKVFEQASQYTFTSQHVFMSGVTKQKSEGKLIRNEENEQKSELGKS
jgi:hypothetical protein